MCVCVCVWVCVCACVRAHARTHALVRKRVRVFMSVLWIIALDYLFFSKIIFLYF